MPVPIVPVNVKNDYKNENQKPLELSFLSNYMPKEASYRSYMVSDTDAENIMKIWLKAKKIDKDTFEVKSISDIDNNIILRLKSRGLISGSTEKVKLTAKGRSVIKTMSLGESNNFLKKRKEKSYTEILANMDKKGKQGYRIAQDNIYSEHSHLLTLVAQNLPYDVEKFVQLLNDLQSHFGKGEVFHGDINQYYEFADEALGTCWIQVYYNHDKNNIAIEKYYENEFLNDEKARTAYVDYNEENIEYVKQEIIKVINLLLND